MKGKCSVCGAADVEIHDHHTDYVFEAPAPTYTDLFFELERRRAWWRSPEEYRAALDGLIYYDKLRFFHAMARLNRRRPAPPGPGDTMSDPRLRVGDRVVLLRDFDGQAPVGTAGYIEALIVAVDQRPVDAATVSFDNRPGRCMVPRNWLRPMIVGENTPVGSVGPHPDTIWGPHCPSCHEQIWHDWPNTPEGHAHAMEVHLQGRKHR